MIGLTIGHCAVRECGDGGNPGWGSAISKTICHIKIAMTAYERRWIRPMIGKTVSQFRSLTIWDVNNSR
jgi:hypothetical protein